MKGGYRPTVLYFEEDEDDRMIFSNVARKLETAAQFIYADSEQKLFEAFENSPNEIPNILIIGLHSSSAYGVRTLKKVFNRIRHFPINIIVFGNSETEQIESLLLGASRYFLKTSNMRDLEEIALLICREALENM